MRVILSATFCEIAHHPDTGFKSRSHMMFRDEITTQTVDVANAPELSARLDQLHTETMNANPKRSFFVLAIKAPRSPGRAFPGFNKREWLRECDAGGDKTQAFQV